MSKPPLGDGDGLRQQGGVVVDLAPPAVRAGFCPAGDIVGDAAQDKRRRHKAPGGQPPRVGNVMQMQKNVFLEFCWDNGMKNSCQNIANQA
jgi:hypothetical protein